jgi:RNA polymerase sigma-70 factor (ECF subfamily)
VSQAELTAHEQFVQDTIACQGALYAFILSLTADPHLADEVLQETNVALLRKEQDFQPGTNFRAWACSLAFYQVLANRKTKQRSRLVFDDELLQTLAAQAQQLAEKQEARRRALRACLAKLSPRQVELLQRRYAGDSVARLATESRRSVGSISQTLYRLRHLLKDCIEKHLRTEGAA